MGSISDIKYVLAQKGLDKFCQAFHIPNDVHPQLPSPNQTIHEMPSGKIGVYTRFFEYANFRLPLSTFLVNVLRYYHINISQLSVIASAKVSHFEILCRVHDIKPAVGLFRCFYVNSKNKWWMSFSKRPDSDAFPEPLLCLIRTSQNYSLDEDTYPTFLHDDEMGGCLWSYIVCPVADPTKVKVGKQNRAEGEARLLDSTVGRVIPLLPIAPARADSVLEASVERLFDENDIVDQGDSATYGGPKTGSKIVVRVRIVDEENVAAEKPKRLRKKRQAVADAGGLSHPPKKLRSEYGVSTTLPFVTSSVFATPEHESGVPVDFVTGLNLRTIGPSESFVISFDSSHHSSINASGSEDNSIIRSAVIPSVMTEAVVATHVASILSVPTLKPSTKVFIPVHAFMFQDSGSMRKVRLDAAGSSHVPRKELSMRSREVDSESLLREFVDHLDPSVLFAYIYDMDYEELFTEFSVGTAWQACLSTKVKMQTEYCLNEKRRLESDCEKQDGLLRARDDEIEGLKAQLLLKEAEVTEAIRLRAEVSKYKAVEKSLC
nr:transposase (putative), gypsy type [Tanacetum cinerariifolium]